VLVAVLALALCWRKAPPSAGPGHVSNGEDSTTEEEDASCDDGPSAHDLADGKGAGLERGGARARSSNVPTDVAPAAPPLSSWGAARDRPDGDGTRSRAADYGDHPKSSPPYTYQHLPSHPPTPTGSTQNTPSASSRAGDHPPGHIGSGVPNHVRGLTPPQGLHHLTSRHALTPPAPGPLTPTALQSPSSLFPRPNLTVPPRHYSTPSVPSPHGRPPGYG